MIFADSSFWLALRFRDDEHHGIAADLWRGKSDSVVTSNHVVGETWTFIRRKSSHRAALQLLDSIESSPRIAVAPVDQAAELEAWTWLRRHDERRYSFVDATSFALMRSLGISEAFAFDGDFAAAGFTELRV